MKSCSQRAGVINSYTTSSIGLNETSSSIPVRTSHPICQRLLDQLPTRQQCRRICETNRQVSCFLDKVVLIAPSSRRDLMFIERELQKILPAPEERNVIDLALFHRRKHCAPLERESWDL